MKFFRQIRKNLLSEGKTGKPALPAGRYLKYAVGEILLVVIGILIALQVNNWNEKRRNFNQIEKYAKSLIEDIHDDIEMIKVIKFTAEQINFRIDSLTNYVRDKKIDEISNLHLMNYTWIQVYRPYAWNRATLDELKSSGSLSLIEKKELLKLISEYDAYTKHMDEDYYSDKSQGEIASQSLSKVVNYNYPNLDQLGEAMRVATIAGQITDVIQDPNYQLAESFDLELITDDIHMVHEAVNHYTRLRFNLRIRTQIELPELLNKAERLIELLEEEYNI